MFRKPTTALKIPGRLLLVWVFILQALIIQAQDPKLISGTVTEGPDGLPLSGATVMVKGAKNGVSTNNEGRFMIQAKPTDRLVFSYTGFKTQEVVVGRRTTIDVVLTNAVGSMDEVIVVGYGAVKKMDLTGSVAQVRMEDMEKAPVNSFTEALAGRVPGVQVNFSDGQPGSAPSIIIRGAGSITQSAEPLYVIDGFPMEDFDASSLNMEEIQSINILKDASATAIYGSRGANGVVVIETKKGKAGKPIITFNPSVGFAKVTNRMEMMSPTEFLQYHNELKPTTTQERYFQNGKTIDSYKDAKGIDWQDVLFGNERLTQIYSLSMRGGNAQTKYSISGSVNDIEGIVVNTGTKRYQGRIAIDQIVNTRFKTGLNINYSSNRAYGVPAAIGSVNYSSFLLYNTWGYRPITGREDFDLLNEDVDDENINSSEIRVNPLRTVENTYRLAKTNDLLAVGYLDVNLTKELTFRTTGNISSRNIFTDAFYNSKTPQGSPSNPSNRRGVNGTFTFSEINTMSNENLLTYNKRINKAHRLNAMVGFSTQTSRRRTQGTGVSFLPNEELGMAGFSEGTAYGSPSGASSFTLMSAFTRINYNYLSKYLVTFTYRADGSSKFAPGNRWGYFPSGAVAWNMSQEDWLKNSKLISNAKLRLSYGQTGNNRVSDFAYLPALTLPPVNSYSFGNGTPQPGAILSDLGNADLRWETSEQIDIGYDLGFLNNRIEFTVDAYQRTTNDLLLRANLPFTTGYTSTFQNIGAIQNRGLEFSLFSVNVDQKKFKWTTGFNISFNKNKVLSLAEGQRNQFAFISFETQYNNTPLYISQVGQPAGMFYGYIFDGVYQLDDFNSPAPGQFVLKNNVPSNGDARNSIQPGDIKYKDLNGDGVVDNSDLSVIGRGYPVHIGGFTNNFRYGAFDLSVFFQWSYGNQIFNANRLMFEGNVFQRTDLNQFKSYVDRWTPENPTNRNFRTGGEGPQGRFSTRTLEDGSYLRLKTVSFGYNLPASVLKKHKISSIRLSVAAQNLLTWTNYSGMDPEVSVRNSIQTPGFDYSAYPNARTIVGRITATF